MNKKTFKKRFISLTLALLMITTVIPMGVFAQEIESSSVNEVKLEEELTQELEPLTTQDQIFTTLESEPKNTLEETDLTETKKEEVENVEDSEEEKEQQKTESFEKEEPAESETKTNTVNEPDNMNISQTTNNVTVQIKGVKKYYGEGVSEATESSSYFEYILRDEQGNEVARTKNGDYGRILFELTFSPTQVGKHKYTVEEVKGDMPYVSYDEHIEEITVNVYTNDSNKLEAEVLYDEDGFVFISKGEFKPSLFHSFALYKLYYEKLSVNGETVYAPRSHTIDSPSLYLGYLFPREAALPELIARETHKFSLHIDDNHLGDMELGNSYVVVIGENNNHRLELMNDFLEENFSPVYDESGNISQYVSEKYKTIKSDQNYFRTFADYDEIVIAPIPEAGVLAEESVALTIREIHGNMKTTTYDDFLFVKKYNLWGDLSDGTKCYTPHRSQFTIDDLYQINTMEALTANGAIEFLRSDEDYHKRLRGKDRHNVNFVNIIDNSLIEDVTAQLKATKTLMGSDGNEETQVAGDFTFILKNDEGNEVSRAYNDAEGNVLFEEMTFTPEQVGEYKYTIEEIKGNSSEIEYDEHIEEVHVRVFLNEYNELQAEVTYDEDGATFTNTLYPKINLRVNKIDSETKEPLEGAVFELYDGETLIGELIYEDGLYQIEGLLHKKYTLKEVSAPNGYKPLNETIEIDLTEVRDASFVIEVENTALEELPATGGAGTTAMMVTGGLLSSVMGSLLVIAKRKNKERPIE